MNGSPRALPPVISTRWSTIDNKPRMRSKPIPAMSISCRCSPQLAQQKIREANSATPSLCSAASARPLISLIECALSPYAAQFEPEERIRVGR